MGDEVEEFVRQILGPFFVPLMLAGLAVVFAVVALKEYRQRRGR